MYSLELRYEGCVYISEVYCTLHSVIIIYACYVHPVRKRGLNGWNV